MFSMSILYLQEAESHDKLVTCVEDAVDRLEDVLQQVQCELSGVQEKMEDIKIEVGPVLIEAY